MRGGTMTNIFKGVKEAVSTRDAASFYGIKVSRNGMCQCPFHNDKHPSMKVDNRFHCFGCGADGDVINFVQQMFGLSPLDATKKLIADFNLPIDIKASYKPTDKVKKLNTEEEELRAFQLYKRDALNYLHEYYYILHCAKRDYAPHTPEELENCNPLFEEALHNLDMIDVMIEELENTTLNEQLDFMNTYKEVIARVKNRVNELNNTRD